MPLTSTPRFLNDRKTSPVRFPLHSTSASWLNASRVCLRNLPKSASSAACFAPSRNSKMPSTASSTIPMQTQSPLPGPSPQQNRRRRQTKEPNVRLDPLVASIDARCCSLCCQCFLGGLFLRTPTAMRVISPVTRRPLMLCKSLACIDHNFQVKVGDEARPMVTCNSLLSGMHLMRRSEYA